MLVVATVKVVEVVVEEVAVGDGGVMLYIIETKIHNYKAIFVVLK